MKRFFRYLLLFLLTLLVIAGSWALYHMRDRFPDYEVDLAIKGANSDATTMAESDEESCDDESSRGLNLNMCSAWTHVCADTLRSIAVLVAAGFASLFPQILSPADADSYGAIVVSVIIIISLAPLVEGLYWTAWEIYHLKREHSKRQQRGHPEEVAVSSFSV